MDDLAKKYSQADFVFVYVREAHPPKQPEAGQPILQPQTYAERLRVVRWVREQTHLQRRLLPDDFGDRSVFDKYFAIRLDNPLVIVDRDGKIAAAVALTRVEDVDPFLERLLAHGGKWDRTLPPLPAPPAQNSSPNFKDMMEHLGRPKK
jgi:hypothetical protein